MSAELLRELARVKAEFQLRTIVALLEAPPEALASLNQPSPADAPADRGEGVADVR